MTMIEFRNKTTGSTMWVAEERAEEYIAAGHRPAALTAEEPKAKPKVKNTTKKKK